MRQLFICSLLATATLFLGGCNTMFFEISDFPQEDGIKENRSFFFWGLTPDMKIDVREKCPYGAAAISEEKTFDNGLAYLLTLGIWAPRNTTYYCIRES
jgi:hypothetical protein